MLDLHTTHQLNDQTRTIIERRCWSVIFNVNGNAPSDATIASFATEELANEAHKLWAAIKDNDKTVSIIVNGERHWDLSTYNVEGYDFDTYYEVVEDWQQDERIFTSLTRLTELCDCSEPTTEPDGITITDGD